MTKTKILIVAGALMLASSVVVMLGVDTPAGAQEPAPIAQGAEPKDEPDSKPTSQPVEEPDTKPASQPAPKPKK